MDSCSVLDFPAPQLAAEITTICHCQSDDKLPTGPETWLCRSWAVDSSFSGWDSPILRWPASGVITKGDRGSLQLWVLCSHSPGIRGESKTATSQRTTAARRVSVKLPNGL